MTVLVTSTTDPTTDKPPRPRRWIPLSLRLFTGLLALLAVAGAWVGWRGYQQKEVIDEIEQLGAYVEFEEVGPDWVTVHTPAEPG